MATKTLGLTGRNYATLAAYASYANALALTGPEDVIVYNDGGAVVDTALVTLSGWTGGSATNTLTVHAATGQGFRDNANVLTNALRYNATNGAALASTASGGYAYTFGNFVIIDGIQFSAPSTCASGVALGTSCVLRNSIVQLAGSGSAVSAGLNAAIENCVIHHKGNATTSLGINIGAGGIVITDTLIITTTAVTGRGVNQNYAQSPQPLIKNTAVFGFGTDFFGTSLSGSTNNATDKATFGGTNNAVSGQTSITSAEWVSTTSGSEDFRLAAGSTKLKNNGATTGPTTDIAGTSRPQGASYDIGPWEAVVAASPPAATISYTEANDTSAITANVTISGVAGTISYTEANDTSAITGSVTTPTITTGAFKNNTGSVLASLTALTVTVLNLSTMAFVKTFTSQTTNASGIMTLTDALLVSGTQYAVVTTNASGTLGVEKYTAA